MKKLLLVCCAFLCSFLTYAQTTTPSAPDSGISSYALKDYNSSLQKNVPPSVAAFHETKLVSVNNHRGAANINVPIYQIKQGGVSIPIRLNYLSTGVKVNSIASSVGLNWSLEAGGSVVKNIMGYEDFSNDLDSKIVAPTHSNQPEKSIENFTKLGWFVSALDASFNNGNILKDLEPDQFYVSAPGLSTSFTHKNYNSTEGTKPYEINFQGNEITTTIGDSNLIDFNNINPSVNFSLNHSIIDRNQTIQCINNIQIKNNQGINYIFNKLDVDQYYTYQIPSSETSSNIPAHSKSAHSREVKAYHLSTITDLNGDDIRFEYETYKMKVTNYDRTQVWDINETTPELRKSIFTKVFYPQLHRIKKIHFKNGSVEFIYGFNRTDLEEDGKALSEIIVRDKHGAFIKKIHLDYTYFISNNNCSQYYCKRLKLKEVYQVDALGVKLPAHQFFYDPTALPVVGASTTDYLGYSKALKTSYAQDLNHNIPLQAPKLTYNAEKSTPSFHTVVGGFYSKLIKIEGRDLTPVFNYAKAGSLVKMITPTGAVQDFEYELNSFLDSGTNVPAAGLRIKRQTITDEKGNVVLLENYMYKNKSGLSTGVVNYVPPFVQTSKNTYFKPYSYVYSGVGSAQAIRIRTYLSSKQENQLSSPGHIVYAKVVVKNGLNNGVTEYNYTTLKKHTIENFITCFDDYTRSNVISNETLNGMGGKFADRDILHGLLTSVKVKDVYNNILKETSYRYDYHLFNKQLGFIPSKKFREDPLGEDPIDYNSYTRTSLHRPKVYSHRYMQTNVVNHVRSPETYISKNITTKFIYDPIYPFVKEETNIINTDTLVTKYHYPTDITNATSLSSPTLSTNSFNTIGLLKNKRMLSYPIQVEKYLNNNKISTNRVNYIDFGNQIYAPENLTASKGDNSLEVTLRQQYDTAGNLVELHRENGTSVVYIYGYNKSSLVAKIENATLSNIPTSYITAIQVASNNDEDRTIDTNTNTHIGTEGNLRRELYKLYNLNSLQQAMITVYTYDPLIGMTSTTDPRKTISYYDYDSFNRLEFVKDHEGNVVKQHCYNYKGERKDCF